MLSADAFDRGLRVGQLAIGDLAIAPRHEPAIDEVGDALLIDACVLELRFGRGGIGGEPRHFLRRRRQVESHEDLAARDGIAFGLQDLGDTRGLRRDDKELGALGRRDGPDGAHDGADPGPLGRDGGDGDGQIFAFRGSGRLVPPAPRGSRQAHAYDGRQCRRRSRPLQPHAV
ncbi:hypothetical protein D3C83_08490 [compost metagenome]